MAKYLFRTEETRVRPQRSDQRAPFDADVFAPAASCRGLEAAAEAARLRLRPILMTSFAFILGVLPLVIAKGAGAEMDQALGTAVFFGMLGVTFFGLIFTPIFFSVIMKIFVWMPKKKPISLEHRVRKGDLVH